MTNGEEEWFQGQLSSEVHHSLFLVRYSTFHEAYSGALKSTAWLS